MKMYKSKTWQHQITCFEGNGILFGVNIFDYEWTQTGERVLVKHPHYNQHHNAPIYTVNIDGELHRFAAAEFSNGVWGFYLFIY